MPDEIDVPLEQSQEHIEKAHEEAHAKRSEDGAEKTPEHASWTRFIAVITAVLAVVAAIGALKSGLLVNEALLAKNDEISLRTQASDQWNYYQAKGIKGVVYTATAALLPPGSPALTQSRAEASRYRSEQKEIQTKAEGLEREAGVQDAVSAHDMDRHHIFAFSVSLCQIAIALSAIAALTRSRRVWVFGLAAGLAGVAALVGGFFGLPLPFAF